MSILTGKHPHSTGAIVNLIHQDQLQLGETLPLVVWAADADGRCTYTNRHWREFTGLEGEAALRDYYVARSATAGLVWVYCDRLVHPGADAPASRQDAAHWYLHGLFA